MLLSIRFSVIFCLLTVSLSGCLSEGADFFGGDDVASLCFLPEEDIAVNSTEKNVEYVRTPDACFAGLDAYPYAPNYALVDGLRMHYLDEGPRDGEVILLLHGQPSWSYLYRKMIPVLTAAGYRVVAVDHIGMGRSDKPIDPSVHVYESHVAWVKQFVDQLALNDITLFVQDWGSLIGLRVAGDMPERFARIVIANGDLPLIPAGFNPFRVPVDFELDSSLGSARDFFENRSSDFVTGFQQWIDYAATVPNFLSSEVVEFATNIELKPSEARSYDAPYPSLIYKAAVRTFPSMIAGIEQQNAQAWANLGMYQKPFLSLAGEQDPNLGSEATQQKWINHVPGAAGQMHARFEAAHFIQEDIGADLAATVVAFIRSNPLPVIIGGARGQFVVEIIKATDSPLRNHAYVCNECTQWADLPQDEQLLLASALENAALPEGFVNGSATLRVYQTSFARSAISGSSPTVDVLEEVPGEEFRFVAVPNVDGFVYADGSTSGLPPLGPPVAALVNVESDRTFGWLAGDLLHELVSPTGTRFALYLINYKADIANLQESFTLPAGWLYSRRVLREDLTIESGAVARVYSDLSVKHLWQRYEEQKYRHIVEVVEGGVGSALNAYTCGGCIPEHLEELNLPAGVTRSPLQVALSDRVLRHASVPEPMGVASSLDLSAEIPGAEFTLISKPIGTQLLGVAASGPMLLVNNVSDRSLLFEQSGIVHEMRSPEGGRYILIAAAAQLAGETDMEALNALAFLDKPEGWSYTSYRLSEDLVLDAHGSPEILVLGGGGAQLTKWEKL